MHLTIYAYSLIVVFLVNVTQNMSLFRVDSMLNLVKYDLKTGRQIRIQFIIVIVWEKGCGERRKERRTWA